jgi:CBS-domain-containing membrane protein
LLAGLEAPRYRDGIVSEGDQLRRIETGTQRRATRRSLWRFDTIASDRELARDYPKSHTRTVKDVMTRDVVSVSDTTELADIANLLETKRIKRVPVVRDGKLVGIVSRANLVRALATTRSATPTIADPDDHTISDQLLAELREKEPGGYFVGGYHRQGSGRPSLVLR